MKLNDCTSNPILIPATYNTFGVVEGIVLAVGAVISATTSIIGGIQQASAASAMAQAQAQQAENARAIAQYNANIARQNNEVAYQMAVYQAQYGQAMAQQNAAMAMQNVALAEMQAAGARRQYEQGMLNAAQQEKDAAATRAQATEQGNREREKNEQQLALMRSKYGASGVAFEGSPLVVLADMARLGEANVQDVIFAGDLQSRKELREAEISKFEAGFSLIDEYGYQVEAENLRRKAQMFEYESELYEYDSVIAGVKLNIGYREAELIALGGEEKASAYEVASMESSYAATGSLISGFGGAASSIASGVGSGMRSYGLSHGKYPTYTPQA